MVSVALDLQPNQLLMGHYTTDDIELGGCWGLAAYSGKVIPVAIDITADELAMFQGSKIVAFRVGLSQSTTVSRVFIIPIGPDGMLGEMTEWACDVSEEGWNTIELDDPYLINLPGDYSLRIGFDYEQKTTSAKPISAVYAEDIVYPSYYFMSNKWIVWNPNKYRNLSLQCICENHHFPTNIIRIKELTTKSLLKIGDELPYSFQLYKLSLGEVASGNCTFDVSIDGQVITTISNPETLTDNYQLVTNTLSTSGLSGGQHTLTVTLTTVNGQPAEVPVKISTSFFSYEYAFSRQMHLMEEFTTTSCTWCPQGTDSIQKLHDMRGDIAWVALHLNYGNYSDPLHITNQTDSILNYENINGFPEATFDRTIGVESDSQLYAMIAAISLDTISTFLDSIAEQPSWATVNVNSSYNSNTREAVITINGELAPEFDVIMGSDSKLTVYLTEDGLVVPQMDANYQTINDYVHNNVLRKALVSVKGVSIKRTSDTTYENVFTYNIPASWNADNMHVVAFISRPLRSGALTDLYVTNTNMRKLGEFDEPVVIIRGDVDGNEKVNIDDVTELINVLLSGTEPANPEAADCYPDGKINIDDVTELINYLLSGSW